MSRPSSPSPHLIRIHDRSGMCSRCPFVCRRCNTRPGVIAAIGRRPSCRHQRRCSKRIHWTSSFVKVRPNDGVKLLMSVPSERRRRAADWHRRQHSATRLQSARRGRMVRRALTMSMMTPQMGPRIVLPEWRADERNPVSAIPSAPLREVAPTWMRPLPPRVVKAADRFDARHSRRAKASSRLYVALVRDVTSGDKSRHFEKEIIELRRNRYWAEPAPPKPKVTDTYVRSPRSGAYSYAGGRGRRQRPPGAPARSGASSATPPCGVETSIWWPRVAWCDSKSLYDRRSASGRSSPPSSTARVTSACKVYHPKRRR